MIADASSARGARARAGAQPADLLSRRREWVGPRCGVVRELTALPAIAGEPPFHQVCAVMSDPRRLMGLPAGAAPLGYGCAWDEAGALRRALGEGLERYAAAFPPRGELRVARAGNLEGHVLPLEGLPRGTDAEYERAGGWVVRPDASLVLSWCRARSLVSHRPTWVPASLAYLPFQPAEGERFLGVPISTGLAAGRTRCEAIFRALCEVVERDALCLAWLLRRPLPQIRLRARRGGRLAAMLAAIQARDLGLTLLDMSLEDPVTSVLAVLKAPAGEEPAIAVGAATAIDPCASIAKAIDEAVAIRSTCIRSGWYNAQPPAFDDVRTVEDHARLFACAAVASSVEEIVDSSETVVEEGAPNEENAYAAGLRRLLRSFLKLQQDVLVVDLTPEDLRLSGIHVVRVLAPDRMPLSPDHRFRYLATRRLREKAGERCQVSDIPHPFA